MKAINALLCLLVHILKKLVFLLEDFLHCIFRGFYISDLFLFFRRVVKTRDHRVESDAFLRSCKLNMLQEVWVMHWNGAKYNIMDIRAMSALFVGDLLLFKDLIEC